MTTHDKLSVIQRLAAKRIISFLSVNDTVNTANATNLLNETYKIVLQYMNSRQDSSAETKFTLFNDISHILLKNFKQISIRDTETLYKFHGILNVLRVSLLTGDDSSVSSLRKFMRGLGECISIGIKRNEIYNENAWGDIFVYLTGKGGYYFSDDIQNREVRGNYIKYIHILAFDYCYGLLRNSVTDVIKKYFYGSFIRNLTIDPRQGEQAKYSLFLAMAVHSFIFYVATRSEGVIDEEREAARSIIYDDDVKENLYIFMNRLTRRSELTDILSRNFYDELESFLYSYEILPDDRKSHVILLGTTAFEFFMFFTGYTAMHCRSYEESRDILDHAFDIRKVRYYFSTEQMHETKNLLADFFKLIENRHDFNAIFTENCHLDGNIVQADRLYDFISGWLKNREIVFAEIEQNTFSLNPKRDDYVRAIAEKQLRSDFAILSKTPVPDSETLIIKKEILNLNVLTHMVYNSNIIESYIVYVSTNLMLQIIRELKRRSNFITVKFSSVDEYLATLKTHNISILVGGEYIINNIGLAKDYKQLQELTDVLKTYQHSYIPAMSALALQNDVLGIDYDYIISEIRPPSDEEICKDTQKEAGLYTYASESFKFTSIEELREYVKNRRKVITVDVKAKITVKNTDCTVGLIIEPA